VTDLEPGTRVTKNPGVVDYRLSTGWGDKVWRVLLTTREPKILAWAEKPAAHGVEVTPMAVSLDEIQFYVAYARRELEI